MAGHVKGRLWLRRAVKGIGLAGAATLAYGGLYERTAYTLGRHEVGVLAPGSEPLRLLQLSDLHVTPNQRGKLGWISELARLVPDLVALTGDILSHQDASEPTLAALAPLFAFPGLFIPGNNDYFAPQLKSPHRYFTSPDDEPDGPPLDWPSFAKRIATDSGWLEMTNTRAMIEVAGRRIDVRGVDDAHLRRDRIADVAGPADPSADLALGLSHTPEPRVLEAYTRDGVALTLSGHTHGGQIRVPGVGAIVTNCGIDRARARGLSRFAAGDRSSWLHVSPGLGTSPFAPVRLHCRPEATLLTLVAVG